MTNNNDFFAIVDLTNAYFTGLHNANTDLLAEIFSPEVVLQTPKLRRSREEWLENVSSRPIPAEEGHDYAYKILSIDIIGEQAMVKVHCPLLGSNFVDFLGLLKEDGKWRFTSKMYAEA